VWIGKEVMHKTLWTANTNARLNMVGFQKYWISIGENQVQFGRGNIGDNNAAEYLGNITSLQLYIAVYCPKRLVLRNIQGSGLLFLNQGIDDQLSQISLISAHMSTLWSSNWWCNEYQKKNIIQIWYKVDTTTHFTLNVFFSSTSSQAGISCYIKVDNGSSAVMKGEEKYCESFFHLELQQPCGFFWTTLKNGEVQIGQGKQIGKHIILTFEDSKVVMVPYVGFGSIGTLHQCTIQSIRVKFV